MALEWKTYLQDNDNLVLGNGPIVTVSIPYSKIFEVKLCMAKVTALNLKELYLAISYNKVWYGYSQINSYRLQSILPLDCVAYTQMGDLTHTANQKILLIEH